MPPDGQDALERTANLAGAIRGSRGDAATPPSPLESAITVEFDTGELPVAVANAQAFFDQIKAGLKAELVDDVKMFLFRNQIDAKELTLKNLDGMIPYTIRFRDGSIEYDEKGKKKYVPLSFISVRARGGVIHLGAYGTSDDAEKALGKVYECLCSAAGMSRQWADASTAIIAKGYATSSVEILDCALGNVLSPALADVFETKHFQQKGYAAQLGVLPLDQETGVPLKRDYHVAIKLGEVEISLVRIDPQSGDTQNLTIAIRPKTTVDAGVSRYVVVSELEYTKHQELVKELKKALKAGGN